MSIRELPLTDLNASQMFGRNLALSLEAGDTVLLEGDLGAGKTTLARAIIEALTGETDIPSPTYTLIQTYQTEGGVSVVHADLYRIEAVEELEELGLEDAFEDCICLIEWPDRLGAAQPENRLEITLSSQSDGSRRVRLVGHGRWESKLQHV